MKQCVITSGKNDFDGLEQQDAKVDKIGDHDVLVKLHAASLNYRDLAIAKVSPLPPSLRYEERISNYDGDIRASTPSPSTSPK